MARKTHVEAALLAVDVAAEAADPGDGVGEVDLAVASSFADVLEVRAPIIAVDLLGRELCRPISRELAGDAEARARAAVQVEVARPLLTAWRSS